VDTDNPLTTRITIIGRLIPNTGGDCTKLARPAWSFRRPVERMVREVIKGTSMEGATKNL